MLHDVVGGIELFACFVCLLFCCFAVLPVVIFIAASHSITVASEVDNASLKTL
jgi:hypothetical protein